MVGRDLLLGRGRRLAAELLTGRKLWAELLDGRMNG